MKLQTLWILSSAITLLLLFGIGWFYSFNKKVFSWIDFFWSASFIIVIIIYQFIKFLKGIDLEFSLLEIMYTIWALRLSSHLFRRIKKHGEDTRYIELKKEWKVWYGLKFFVLFEAEALLTLVLCIPLFLTYFSGTNLLQYISLVLFIGALIGETVADTQLKKFILSNKDRSKVCDVGLWKYSRHPNYFFEWMIWVSYGVYGLSSEEKWPAFIPLVVMYLLLTKVSGIPPAEKSSLKSKKENYMEYQKKTNAFFPWFPKIVFIFLVMNSLSFNQAHASRGNMNQQEKIKYVFDNLRVDNLVILDDFYAKKTTFIDPLGSHEGIESVKSYYENLYKNVKSIKFKYNDLISNGNSHVLVWTMTLSAEGLKGGESINLEGTSHIKFNESNLVIYHRDYFDMGEFIYEHVPVLGWTIKKVKNKLRGEK